MHRNTLTLLIILILTIFGCEEENKEDDFDTLAVMGAEIYGLIEDKSCNDVSDCRSIGFGDKPCGGPWSYLIYSIVNVDTVDLLAKVQSYNDYERELNLKWGAYSDCSFAVPPVLGVVHNACTSVDTLQ